MAALTVRLPDETAQRLKSLVKQQGKSLNKLFEQLSVQTLANWDVENRFKVRASHGDTQKALAILDLLDERDGKS
jgi:predicted DNA-binding protein